MPRARRAAGELDGAILRLLQEARRPLRALELREQLHRTGQVAAMSQIFRAIGKLMERGMIHKVAIARGYLPGSGARRIALVCRGCGSVTAIECGEVFDFLDGLAVSHALASARPMVEVPGLCSRCRAGDGDA